jgi:acyl-CoA synthetase (AMP-forming)/AMP-acid ligase II
MRLPLEHIGAVHDLIRDVRWSGPELAAEARRRARLLARFVGDGENLFVIAHGNSPSFFADLFAVWEAGGGAVCVNQGLTPGELANIVAFTEPRAVLTGDADVAAVGVPVLRTAEETAPADAPTPAGDMDDPALLLFTSGTTGDPKGVLHTHRSIQARLALNQQRIGAETLARSLCVLPTHFGHGLIGNCLTPLFAGGDLYLMHGAGVAGTARLGEVLATHDIRFMSSVPAFWKLALRLAPAPEHCPLRRVQIGSAPLSAELWQGVADWTGAEVLNMYGITETANWIGGASSAEHAPQDGLLGRPWGGRFAVLGDDGRPAAAGQGEILLQVPSIMRGYYRRADLTAEVLRDGWYHTGDTGSLDADGLLRLTGRNRYAINRGGIKVYPEELDLLLERHPDVVEACAFGIDDPVSGQVAAAAVRLRGEAGDAPGIGMPELLAWVRERIRPEAVPSRLFAVAEIPKTDRGKLNRDRVARHCLGDRAEGVGGVPASASDP